MRHWRRNWMVLLIGLSSMGFILIYGSVESLLLRPAFSQTLIDKSLRKSALPTPLGRSQTNSLVFDDTVRALIVRLTFRGGPSAVLWGIGTIVVNAVDGISLCCRMPHVCQKRLERFKPTVTDGNSASAPGRIMVICFRVTAAFEARPSPIGFGMDLAVCPVRFPYGNNTLGSLTSTTCGDARTKVIGRDLLLHATLATAEQIGGLSSSLSESDHSQKAANHSSVIAAGSQLRHS